MNSRSMSVNFGTEQNARPAALDRHPWTGIKKPSAKAQPFRRSSAFFAALEAKRQPVAGCLLLPIQRVSVRSWLVVHRRLGSGLRRRQPAFLHGHHERIRRVRSWRTDEIL